jgi:hypothetical protein
MCRFFSGVTLFATAVPPAELDPSSSSSFVVVTEPSFVFGGMLLLAFFLW